MNINEAKSYIKATYQHWAQLADEENNSSFKSECTEWADAMKSVYDFLELFKNYSLDVISFSGGKTTRNEISIPLSMDGNNDMHPDIPQSSTLCETWITASLSKRINCVLQGEENQDTLSDLNKSELQIIREALAVYDALLTFARNNYKPF